ncbi:MAG: DUF4276 family protein [Aquabacterium sp.]|nr:DUF4276 family protein [Aquabacterium sp.]
MAIEVLHVLVEEPSMEVALQFLLPRLLRKGIQVELRQFQCKSELLKQLPQRLAGYAQWLPDTAAVLVVVDRDDDDCIGLKAQLDAMARAAGLVPRSDVGPGGRFQVINRIAIEELEAWFFGDWPAVCEAYPKMPHTLPRRAGFRDPDAIAGGTWEALERELQRKGYFKQGLRKSELAREVASRMDPARNHSASFGCLRAVLAQL